MSIREDRPVELELLEQNEVSKAPAVTPEVLRETAPIYERVRHIIPEISGQSTLLSLPS
jgi:hypothetical protein